MKYIFRSLLVVAALALAFPAAAQRTDRLDGIQTGLAIKAPVKAVSTTNLTLSGTQTVNGVALVAEDRVLVAAQTDATENGIYVVKTTAWTRASDFDGNRDVADGTLVTVQKTTGANIFYQVDATDPVVIGTSSISFLQVSDPNVQWPITAQETAGGLTTGDITDSYEPGDLRRYGAVGDGTTNDRAAFVLADAIGIPLHARSGLDYVIATSLTITNSVIIEAGSSLKPSSGAVITLSASPVIAHRETAFTGDGTVVFTKQQTVVVDWWDKTSATAIQKAIDAAAQGSHIDLCGTYTTNGITLDSDEANQTGDIGKSIVGCAGPGTRIRDNVSGGWGAEIYLADSQNTNVINMTGTAQNGGSSRYSVVLDNLKINGNKANQTSGNCLHISYVKDLWIGRLLLEDCDDNGLDDTNANNQIHWEYLEVQNADNDGINLGATGDSQGIITKAATNGNFGISIAAGHWYFGTIHAYLNSKQGFNYTNVSSIHIDSLRVNDNGLTGARVNNADGLFINKVGSWNNGTDATAAASDRVGLKLMGTTANTTILGHESFDNLGGTGTHDGSGNAATLTDSGASFTVDDLIGQTVHNTTDGSQCTVLDNDATTVTCSLSGGSEDDWDVSDAYIIGSQQYHLYVSTTGSNNHIGPRDYDDRAGTADIAVLAAARNSLTMTSNAKRVISTTTGDVELNPQDGDLVLDTALTGTTDFDYTTANKVPNGHRQKVILQDGGGQNITFGTNATAIATAPTPATNAKHNIMEIEYYDGEAFLVRASQEP